jgi:Na+-transporting NADH:ubiquinone oxidoreductase subunit NqrF
VRRDRAESSSLSNLGTVGETRVEVRESGDSVLEAMSRHISKKNLIEVTGVILRHWEGTVTRIDQKERAKGLTCELIW